MTKTVSLNDMTYSELAVLAGRLSMLAKRPISLGMTVAIATEVFDNLLRFPGVEELLARTFSKISTGMLTPEEFDIHWDEFYKIITEKKK